MATLGLKEMGKFLWEGRENGRERKALERKITKYVGDSGALTHDLVLARQTL